MFCLEIVIMIEKYTSCFPLNLNIYLNVYEVLSYCLFE